MKMAISLFHKDLWGSSSSPSFWFLALEVRIMVLRNVEFLKVSHSTGTGGSSLVSLVIVEGSHFGSGVAARSAGGLLDVEGSLSASSADSMGLGVSFTE